MTASFTVFVCSTFSDLSQEREAVLDAIRRLKLQHDSMEFFGARAEQPIETCLQEVRESDVLVVIVSHRYGTIVPDPCSRVCQASPHKCRVGERNTTKTCR